MKDDKNRISISDSLDYGSDEYLNEFIRSSYAKIYLDSKNDVILKKNFSDFLKSKYFNSVKSIYGKKL